MDETTIQRTANAESACLRRSPGNLLADTGMPEASPAHVVLLDGCSRSMALLLSHNLMK
jgi:hypothetical protein